MAQRRHLSSTLSSLALTDGKLTAFDVLGLKFAADLVVLSKDIMTVPAPEILETEVLMTILGGTGTLLGPVIGAAVIKYFENIFSAFNEGTLMAAYSFLPETLQHLAVRVSSLFVGEGWHLTLGALFMIIVIFLPGGLMEGINRMVKLVRSPFVSKSASGRAAPTASTRPGE